MHKVGFIGRYLPGVSKADGRAHWEGQHAAITAAVPGIVKYRLNFATANLGLVDVNDDPTRFDGYACIWFADQAAFDSAMQSPEWGAVVADAAEFLDVDFTLSMASAVEENVVIDGPEGPFKAVWVCRFKDEIRAEESKTAQAHAYWKGTHGSHYGVKVPGIDRYVQNHNTASITGNPPEFDGFSECWFQDRAAFDVTMEAPEWDEMNNDAPNLFVVEEFIVDGYSALIDEITIKDET
jgi:uncharacterized protein (TIGR02118 family)